MRHSKGAETGDDLMRSRIRLRHFLCAAIAFAVISIASFPLPAAANAAAGDPNKTLSPYFLVKGDPNVDRLPLKDTSVEIAVSGVIADVRVLQTYRNEGSRAIHATYVFPASTRAAVYGMRMRIDDE